MSAIVGPSELVELLAKGFSVLSQHVTKSDSTAAILMIKVYLSQVECEHTAYWRQQGMYMATQMPDRLTAVQVEGANRPTTSRHVCQSCYSHTTSRELYVEEDSRKKVSTP